MPKGIQSNKSLCKICNIEFKNQYELRSHNQKFHNDKEYICEICGKKFQSSQAFAGHKQKHSNKSNWIKCNICGRLFKNEQKLQQHIKNIHCKKYICQYCNKEFDSIQQMNGHITLNHKEYNMNNTKHIIECDYCEQTFNNIGAFKRHLLIHIDPIKNKLISKNIKLGIELKRKNNLNHRKNLSISKMGNNNPIKKLNIEQRKSHASKGIKSLFSRLENKLPKSDITIINLNIDNLLYVGNGEFFVLFENNKLKNPDFLIKNSNKVIEVISEIEFIIKGKNNESEYFEYLNKNYLNAGYQLLIIHYKELENLNNIKNKILKFIEEDISNDYKR